MSYTRNYRTGSKKNIRTSNGPAPAAPGTVRYLTPEQYREEVLGLPPLPPAPRHWRKLVALALVAGFTIGYCTPAPAQELRDPYFDAMRPGLDRYPFQTPAQASRQLDAEREARRYQDRQLDAIDAAARRAEQAADQRDFQRRLEAIYGR